jgi:putative endonuclease
MSDAKHISTGKIGEELACKYLKNRGFTIVERNFRKKWGEIDIVSRRKDKIHFVEVKAGQSNVDPQEHLTSAKIKKLFRVFESYALEHGFSIHTSDSWQFDAVIVRIDAVTKQARVKYIGNIVVE